MAAWANHREQKLGSALDSAKANEDLIGDLHSWLSNAETRLGQQEAESMPDEVPIIEQLLEDHATFQTEMGSRQPEVERLTKLGRKKDERALKSSTKRGYGRVSTP